jgi:hypothetical protein
VGRDSIRDSVRDVGIRRKDAGIRTKDAVKDGRDG